MRLTHRRTLSAYCLLLSVGWGFSFMQPPPQSITSLLTYSKAEYRRSRKNMAATDALDSAADSGSAAITDSKDTNSVQSSPPSPSKTFYRRTLPNTLISFASTEGRQLFASAMTSGGTFAFFSLIEQLQTQPEPAYCGLTTLVIVLNALAVDPRRSWKGPWRWYHESMLNCCVDLEEVKATGITFNTFACLAKCQGLDVTAIHGSDSSVDEFRQVVKDTCTSSSHSGDNYLPSSFLVVSYTRKVLGQTGTGHFSPIGAYDEASDNVLILDTARFKYGPHWVPLSLLFEALIPEDPDTGKSRGYVVISYDGRDDGLHHVKNETCNRCKTPLPLSVLFRSMKSKDYLRKEFKEYMQSQNKITLTAVSSFWTKEHTNIWELVQPQLQPVESRDVTMVNSLRELLKRLVAKEELDISVQSTLIARQEIQSSKSCCTSATNNNSERTIEISPSEALFVVYLAILPRHQRRDIVFEKGVSPEKKIDVDETVREQLLAEAALVSYAFETCDWDDKCISEC